MTLIFSPIFASMMNHTEIMCISRINGPNPEEQPRVTVARSVLKVTRAFLLWSELWWGEEASPHLPVPIALC